MNEDERLLAWTAVMKVLTDYEQRIGTPWPPEFVGCSDAELLEAILRTEKEVRAGLDATARSLARNQSMPDLSELERWHFAHRLVFAKAESERRYAEGAELPDDEDLVLELMLIDGWFSHVEAWRERMRLLADAL